MKILFISLLLFLSSNLIKAEDGHELWLRYQRISGSSCLENYNELIHNYMVLGNSPTLEVVQQELQNGLTGLLGAKIDKVSSLNWNKTIIAGTLNKLKEVNLELNVSSKELGSDGYFIYTKTIGDKTAIVISGNTDLSVLYGTYAFLRMLQTQEDITNLNIKDIPKTKLRMLNHWTGMDVNDDPNEESIWHWNHLPYYVSPRIIQYARANASVGINAIAINTVNADPCVLDTTYLKKAVAIANVFRPYGIKVFLSVNFNSPELLGGLETSDPLDPNVKLWWSKKIDTVYKMIPDFAGFIVKANSESEPGPQDFNRTHADGANMLASALEPHNGVLIWRAFVYNPDNMEDRVKQAYDEFVPLDGKFKKNVVLQVKNGPLDFQPREPYHPLFGSMPKTPMMLELEIYQEYLGQYTSLVYLAPLFKECLDTDTYSQGKGSTVGKIIDGSLNGHTLSGMAAVANINNDRNWTTHPFGQANWYAFGRLSWNHNLSSKEIADEWIKMTFSNDKYVVNTISDIMMRSREVAVDYMMPLGLHHIFSFFINHYGPGPWVDNTPRRDWNCTYYHKADEGGIGFDRTSKGSNAISQYPDKIATVFENLGTCPDKYLLWFHHLSWDYKMRSGKTLWYELLNHYYRGAKAQQQILHQWDGIKGKIDSERFDKVHGFLELQTNEALWWRNACVLYFQSISKRAIPEEFDKPVHSLEFYKKWLYPFPPQFIEN